MCCGRRLTSPHPVAARTSMESTLHRAAGHTAIVVAYPGLKSGLAPLTGVSMAAGIYDDSLFGQTKISTILQQLRTIENSH